MRNFFRALLTPTIVDYIAYTNTPESPYCVPAIGGFIGDYIEFNFILDESWNCLLYTSDAADE